MASARRSLFSLVQSAAAAHGPRTAVSSPFQQGSGLEKLSYADLHSAAYVLGGRLKKIIGPELNRAAKQPAIISDLPNTVENILLQIACSQQGVAYATVKDAEMLKGFAADEGSLTFVHSIRGTDESWLAAQDGLLPRSTLADELFDYVRHGASEGAGDVLEELDESMHSGDPAHAFFNSNKKPLTFAEMRGMGESARQTLGLKVEDRVCVSITLCHPFGVGSGVCSVFSAGATLVLPAVGGIRGCGVPAERAAACLQVLKDEQCTVLFSDKPVAKQLNELMENENAEDLAHLRTGVVKTGSGSDFLGDKIEFAGKELWTMGKL